MARKWTSAAARRICEFAGKPTVESAVREVARRLLEGQDPPPTNLDTVFPRVDVRRCFPDPELAIAGELRRVEDGFEIAYNESEPAVRRRFTIAHEIGHAVIERTGPRCPRHGRELERICDLIASELLMPSDVLKDHVRLPVDLAGMSRIASRFDVSLTAVAIRSSAEFGVIVAQVEGDELAWCSVSPRWELTAARSQIARLVADVGEEPTGIRRVTLKRRIGTRGMVMEWRRTGADRKLFVLRESGDADSNLPESLPAQISQ